MLAHGCCGCPAGHGEGHSGTGGCDPTGISWHWGRAGVGVPRCPPVSGPASLCPSVSCSLPGGARPAARSPAGPRRSAGNRPGLKALCAGLWLGAGLGRARSSEPGQRRCQSGERRAEPRGAGAATRGGDGPCRSRCVGRYRVVPVPLRGTAPVPLRRAGPCGAVAGVWGGAVPVPLRGAAPVPVRGVEPCCAGAGPRGGDELCRSRGVGRRRAAPVPLSGAVPVPVGGADPVPCSAAAGPRGDAPL